MTQTTRRVIPGWVVLAVLALLVAAALTLNWWNHRQQTQNVRENVDTILEELCPSSDPC